jgi:hypothetical protein
MLGVLFSSLAQCRKGLLKPSLGPNPAHRSECENVENQRLRHDIGDMPNIDLPEDEYAAVVAAVRKTIDQDKYPMSPRLAPSKAVLAKLDPIAAPKPIIQRSALAEAPTRSRGGHRARR